MDQVELVSWTAMLIEFLKFLRASNLVALPMETFDPDKQLMKKDVKMAPGMLMFEFSWAKNIQFKQKTLQVPVLAFHDKEICLVYWFSCMINKIPTGPRDPAFIIKVVGKAKSLSSAQNYVQQICHKDIEGINVYDYVNLISQFADDTDLFLKFKKRDLGSCH